MEGTAIGGLLDLLPAAEAVRDDQRIGRGGSHRGEKDPLADRERDLVMRFLEPEGARHPAAAGIGEVHFESRAAEEAPVRSNPEDRPLMAVERDERPPSERAGSPFRSFLFEELGEEMRAFGEPRRARVVREELGKLVAEDGGAARFQEYDRYAGLDDRRQDVENFV